MKTDVFDVLYERHSTKSPDKHQQQQYYDEQNDNSKSSSFDSGTYRKPKFSTGTYNKQRSTPTRTYIFGTKESRDEFQEQFRRSESSERQRQMSSSVDSLQSLTPPRQDQEEDKVSNVLSWFVDVNSNSKGHQGRREETQKNVGGVKGELLEFPNDYYKRSPSPRRRQPVKRNETFKIDRRQTHNDGPVQVEFITPSPGRERNRPTSLGRREPVTFNDPIRVEFRNPPLANRQDRFVPVGVAAPYSLRSESSPREQTQQLKVQTYPRVSKPDVQFLDKKGKVEEKKKSPKRSLFSKHSFSSKKTTDSESQQPNTLPKTRHFWSRKKSEPKIPLSADYPSAPPQKALTPVVEHRTTSKKKSPQPLQPERYRQFTESSTVVDSRPRLNPRPDPFESLTRRGNNYNKNISPPWSYGAAGGPTNRRFTTENRRITSDNYGQSVSLPSTVNDQSGGPSSSERRNSIVIRPSKLTPSRLTWVLKVKNGSNQKNK